MGFNPHRPFVFNVLQNQLLGYVECASFGRVVGVGNSVSSRDRVTADRAIAGEPTTCRIGYIGKIYQIGSNCTGRCTFDGHVHVGVKTTKIGDPNRGAAQTGNSDGFGQCTTATIGASVSAQELHCPLIGAARTLESIEANATAFKTLTIYATFDVFTGIGVTTSWREHQHRAEEEGLE